MFEDKTLVCKDCGKEFVWTAGEQEFYASRGFENQPQRCKPCRDARKNATRGERQMCIRDRGISSLFDLPAEESKPKRNELIIGATGGRLIYNSGKRLNPKMRCRAACGGHG